jgi:lysine biosynthesis protein LysW
MEMKCPGCGAALKVGEKHHYQLIKCPKCGREFQALGRETVNLTREYLEKMKKKDKGKDGKK